jgi:large subunit ribosomal protein L17
MASQRILSRKSDNRNHLYRNLATSLVLYEKVDTTEAKSKELKRLIDKLISTAKKNDLSARRAMSAYLFDNNAVDKMFDVLVPRYSSISSGFSTLAKIASRKGDGAMTCRVELINPEIKTAKISAPKKDNDDKDK